MTISRSSQGSGTPAITELEVYVQANPGDAAAHHQLGLQYQSAADKEQAYRHYATAVTLQPEHLGYLRSLADFTYVEMGKTEEAVTLYVRVLKFNPRDAESLTILGNIAVSLERFDEAKIFFGKLLEVEPWNLTARKTLDALARRASGTGGARPSHDDAREKAQSGDALGACAILQELVRRDPGNALALNDLGVLLYGLGEKEEAGAAYEAAVRLEPANPVFKKNLADFLFIERGATEEALKLYVELLQQNPKDPDTLLAIGSVCAMNDRLDDARSFFQAVLEHDPSNEQARTALRGLADRTPAAGMPPEESLESPMLPTDPRIDRILREKERYAREYLQEVVDRDPANASAQRHLDALPPAGDAGAGNDLHVQAAQRAAQGDEAGAVALLERLLDDNPHHALAHNDLGVLRYRSGDIAGAQAHYEAAVRIEPGNAVFLKNLADFLFIELGRPEEAMQKYVAILQQNPADLETLLAVGRVCESLRQEDDARHFYRTILTLEPYNTGARDGLQRLSKSPRAI
jgi:tetratricopeptide (TPR) repeat protein